MSCIKSDWTIKTCTFSLIYLPKEKKKKKKKYFCDLEGYI